jgi:hypothetical protein
MTTTIGYNPYPKSVQLTNTSVKLSQKQMWDISQKVDRELKKRSEGNCELREKCTGALAVQRAHITARGKLNSKTTVNDLLHTCVACHQWLDRDIKGIQYKRSLVDK